jgi:hypothetical protein
MKPVGRRQVYSVDLDVCQDLRQIVVTPRQAQSLRGGLGSCRR